MTTTPIDPADDPLSVPRQIQGWMSPAELRWIYDVGRMFEHGRIVEVGVWKGRSLAAFAVGMQTGQLVGIDNMSGRHSWNVEPDVQDQRKGLVASMAWMTRTLPDLSVAIVERDSVAASEAMHGGIDCVFVDGDHREGYVEADILAWSPLVRPLGIIAGHDYNEPGVRAAVDRLLPDAENPVGSIWYKVLAK